MQDPASGYGQPQQPMYTKTSPQPSGGSRKRRAGCIIVPLVVIVLLALVGGGLFHYLGPTRTVESFFQASIVHYDGGSAYTLLCPDVQAKLAESQLQATLDTAKSTESPWDTSHLTYTLVDEEFFGIAHVRLGGSVTATVSGQTQTATFDNPDKDLLTLRSSGIGWCLTDSNLTLGGSSGQ